MYNGKNRGWAEGPSRFPRSYGVVPEEGDSVFLLWGLPCVFEALWAPLVMKPLRER